MGNEVHKHLAMIQEECPLVAVMGTLGEGCDIFPEHKTEHLIKPGSTFFDFA